MARLKLVKTQHSLVYGMRLFYNEVLPEQEHPRLHIPLPGGRSESLTLHTITGDKEEIKRKLAESIDAFFEILGDDLA